jgi:outer membrane protein assembly factor BamB
LNASAAVKGDVIYAGQGEENFDEATMGRLIALDGKGSGDLTKANELWRFDKIEIGYTAPAIHENKIFVIDNSGNLFAIDLATGKELWKQNLGTVGKGSPVWADGKIYATEVNGTFAILQDGDTEGKVLHTEKLTVNGTRPAEIYGSPAIAYGRIYFESEAGLYCLGNKTAKFQVDPPKVFTLPGEDPVDKSAPPASIQVIPAEILMKPGEAVTFKAKAYNAKGQFLQEVKPTWTVTGLKSQVDETGKFVAGTESQAGVVTAQMGDLKAIGRVRIIADLPMTENFDSIELEKIPPYWIGAAGKFFVREKDGAKVLVKPVRETGLQTAEVYIGPTTWSNYTIQADVMGAQKGRRMPDIGLLNSGYSLILAGSHQRVQILSWAAELRINQVVDFPWKPDTWYTMKFEANTTGDKGIIRGKVWPKGEPEPEAWTISVEDAVPIRAASPGIYGFSTTEIYYDNIQVTKSAK